MFWIALQPSRPDDGTAWGWRCLQFTPRVAVVDEALLLEVGASERLFGGRRRLVQQLLQPDEQLPLAHWGAGASSLVALALLRLQRSGEPRPRQLPDDLPLPTLTAALPHLDVLERIGCRRWGQLRALPRAGVSRRFGAALLQALDAAWGERPERYAWLELPQEFDQPLELPLLATSAGELMDAAQHLLTRLQCWLQARNRGVLALELEWTHDLRKRDGQPLPPTASLEVRTAQPTQDLHHLRRLASEQLARASLAAPANRLRLRSLETQPWGGATTSLLPGEEVQGERLHQLVERLSARLGEDKVSVPVARQDHRPECMQQWRPARGAPRPEPGAIAEDVLLPAWLLREPLLLAVRQDKPWYQGPLQLLTRARRVEAAWWDPAAPEPALRDYFIARSERAGLLWVFRERLAADQERARWFLQGLYA